MNANKFKYFVAERGMTLNELADKIGMNNSTLYRKMNGISDFRRNEILECAKILKITEDELLDIFFK